MPSRSALGLDGPSEKVSFQLNAKQRAYDSRFSLNTEQDFQQGTSSPSGLEAFCIVDFGFTPQLAQVLSNSLFSVLAVEKG